MVLASFVSRHSHSLPPLLIHQSNLFLLRQRGRNYLRHRYIWISTEKMPIVAEYAKSNRSSCKACSKSIATKTLRLGLISKGPGGFDMTRWHHLDCFPSDSESIASVDDIKGLSALEKDDQDALAKLVEQCGQPSNQVDEKVEEITHLATDDVSGEKIKETKGSSKVIAEYAKSSRSSCKKCSQTIAAKELRLGLVTRDSRGFDMTKWHHLACFPVDSDPVDSVEDIGGFSSLQSGDQDALKDLVQQCENKTLLTEETNKRKHSQVGEMEMVEETNTSQPTTRKPKMNTSESTSQVVGEAEISLSASDVKEKYRDARLLPKWKAFETVIFLERDEGLNDSEKIAAFDFDGCLAKTSVKVVGADAWSLMYPSIPEKLQSLHSQGYKLVIFTNESNIDRWKNKRQAAVDSKIGRLNSFIKRVEVPIQVFIACGVASSGGKDDLYRKPKPGMWQLMKKHLNSGIEIDMDESFYVGDAAGRKGDHSDADIKFAQASGLKFYTPEEYFLS
ncbi:polynucleotide 3'-phosphatase ZDP isoform X2 [Raphanus sativus]|uniref:Polynucleotide 3'-phosphatase ZDP isoform X2 n=1 Tax=Raphanus sativus TaxID=3726 RepID=A0A6J0NPS2_RAPSA|nr:polynucleotide 3'-phosphatase ZDP isoform X2 [Raphanus sativus]